MSTFTAFQDYFLSNHTLTEEKVPENITNLDACPEYILLYPDVICSYPDNFSRLPIPE